MRSDDSKLSPKQIEQIQKHALKSLENAAALGRYPTPVADVLDCAKLVVADENIFEERFLEKLRNKFTGNLKKALSKVLGIFDCKENLIYIDKTLLVVKQTFLKLHETGHAILPWQRDIYGGIEDCKQTLDSDISDQFDREANVFASDVLFQLDDFSNRAAEKSFGIKVPIDLSKRYGASIYSSLRRYVSKNKRSCAVIVINPPQFVQGDGFTAEIRRVVCSDQFNKLFRNITWPCHFTPDDDIGAMIPLGKQRMSAPRSFAMIDSNGTRNECIAEAFATPYQIFVLIYVASSLTKKIIIFP